MTGFTFCGKHSYRDFGIVMQSKARRILADRRKRQVEIAGRHGVHTFDGETYDIKLYEINCFVGADSISRFRWKEREIAAWLTQYGELSFDDEPGFRCSAAVYSAIAPEEYIANGIFPIIFECDPIAKGAEHILRTTFTSSGQKWSVPYDGTAPAPCRIILRNTGSEDVSGITITMVGRKKDV